MGARERVASAALSFLFCISFAKLNAILVSLKFFICSCKKNVAECMMQRKRNSSMGGFLEKRERRR